MASIGKYTKEHRIKAIKKANRELELEERDGWKAITVAHASEKTYNRKKKHKNKY